MTMMMMMMMMIQEFPRAYRKASPDAGDDRDVSVRQRATIVQA